jgi:hypothetical protein
MHLSKMFLPAKCSIFERANFARHSGGPHPTPDKTSAGNFALHYAVFFLLSRRMVSFPEKILWNFKNVTSHTRSDDLLKKVDTWPIFLR